MSEYKCSGLLSFLLSAQHTPFSFQETPFFLEATCFNSSFAKQKELFLRHNSFDSVVLNSFQQLRIILKNLIVKYTARQSNVEQLRCKKTNETAKDEDEQHNVCF